MTELLSVVAVIDDSESARYALKIAALLADEEKGGRLFAAHAIPEVPHAIERILVPYACFGDDHDALRAELNETVHARLEKRLRPLLGKEATLRVDNGPVVPTLQALLEKLGPDIAVFGPSDAPQAATLGATVDAFLRDATVPVLLARASSDDTPSIERIIVAVDLSDQCAQLVTYAVTLAQRLGAKVQPVFVLPSHVDGPHADFLPADRGLGGKTKKAITARWMAIESTLKMPFPVESDREEILRKYIATTGDPGVKLVEIAEEMSADLVIAGRRSTHGASIGLGRVAEFVARRAAANVLLVPLDDVE